MSKVVRSVKNVTKRYSQTQIKVRNATSNDSWGPTGAEMSEIAQLTFADTATFYEIMDILDKRLNDKGKNWRHVLKSLKVLDYCLHEGSELVVTWAKENIYIIRTLREFTHIDDDHKDVGLNVRISAKDLTALIMDDERLRIERRDRKSWKSRVSGLNEFEEPHARPKRRERPQGGGDDDDLEYKLAIEASKNEAEEAAKRKASKKSNDDDDDLAKAIKLSKEEEELRRRELETSQVEDSLLIDDTPVQSQPQSTGWNQGYQQQPTVDWFGNVIDQPQQTGYNGYQNQNQTGYGFPQQGMQPQMTGYNASFIQPQQTSFIPNTNANNNNPYGQNAYGSSFGNSFAQQPGAQQQETPLSSGSNNPWGNNSNGSSAQTLGPQPTGSNNPFASTFNRQQTTQAAKQPTLNSLQEQNATTSFNPILGFSAPSSPQPVQPYNTSQSSFSSLLQQQQPQQQMSPVKSSDPHHARLNALLASGDGQDTFGNTGETRIPAQHTLPGTFVNSAGANLGRLTSSATGNPFMNSQFTGMPQQGLHQAPTGYGNMQFQRQGQNGQAGSNLIDL